MPRVRGNAGAWPRCRFVYLHKGELDQVISIYPTVRHHRVYSDSTAPLSHHTRPHAPRLNPPKREPDTRHHTRPPDGHHTQQGAHVAQITAASSHHATPQQTIFLPRRLNVKWTRSQRTLVMRTAAHGDESPPLYKYYEDARDSDGSPTDPETSLSPQRKRPQKRGGNFFKKGGN